MTFGPRGGSVDGACTRMSPFLDQLAAGLGLILGAASVLAVVWGAARRQRGREAVDDQHEVKIDALATSSSKHATELTKQDRRILRIEIETGIEAK